MRLADACDRFLQYKELTITQKTCRLYRLTFNKLMRWWVPRNLHQKDVSVAFHHENLCGLFRWLLDDGRPASTILVYRKVLILLEVWLLKQSKLKKRNLPDIHPLRLGEVKAKPRPARQPFTPEDYRLILRQTSKKWDLWRIPCMVAWETAMRFYDVMHLQSRHVDFDKKSIVYMPHKTKARNVHCEVPVSDALLAKLRPLCGRKKDTYLFPEMLKRYSKPTSRMDQVFIKMLKEIGIKRKSFHCFRHSFVSRAFERGINPVVIGSMTGQSLDTLTRYCKPNLDFKRKALGIK